MARVRLIQEHEHPELAALIEKIRVGRRGQLINIYRMLLNAPALAESWFNHSNAVRWRTSLGGRLREIVIIRLGYLTGSQYVLRIFFVGGGSNEDSYTYLTEWEVEYVLGIVREDSGYGVSDVVIILIGYGYGF